MHRLSYLLLAAAVAAGAALSIGGCQVDAYCVTCADGGMDAEPRDAGSDEPDADAAPDAIVDAMPDALPPDAGCVEERCNGKDDDCDGKIDEDFDFDTDPRHCGECGNACSPPHAFPSCEGGECAIDECASGFYDLNEDPSDGCEYRCRGTMDDDSVCDLRDNDCDGEVDEDVDLDNDPENCGACGIDCSFPHSTAACEEGECALGECEAGHYDLDGRQRNGCEYACVPADPAEESCNLVDDDCDGEVDEGDPGGGAECGNDMGVCEFGVEECVGGSVVCTGGVSPDTEMCNGIDDDCDGEVDENNPEGGGVCGEGTGTCERGREQCMDGELVCVGAVGPEEEVCDGLDNDCDGTIDEGNPEGGAACGDDTGACELGTRTCSGGVLVCMGGTGPSTELCNGVDDDCDGNVDEGNPEGGALCGTDVGTCSTGSTECMGGELVCVGDVGPEPETCDGRDNDCDGTIDEGNPDGGGACGETTGACEAGEEVCSGGVLVCMGAVGPSPEECNGIDDDCDGATDEDFDLSSDANNCGACGNECSFDNGFAACSGGDCVLTGCRSGFHDIDGDPSNGCEYACDPRGAEICNGADDDCDGETDEGLTPPENYCNPNGVCSETEAECGGADGWVCNYPAEFEDSETLCDDLDNDCDGAVDELYERKGQSCSNGEGVCRRVGEFVCNATGDDVECDAPPAGMSSPEVCDGLDNDCDGIVDERAPGDDGVGLDDIPTVSMTRPGGGAMEIMQYEASRPDADASSRGSSTDFACAKENVVPWTNVTWDEARDACCALNEDGACREPTSGDPGWRLCPTPEWQVACEGPSASCTWSYQNMCEMSQPTTCNGKEYDCDPDAPGLQDCLANTGSPTFAECNTDWGADGAVYDLSGNAKEWTATPAGDDGHEIRGGAYTSIEIGRSCEFSFTVAPDSFAHPNTGFRCCYYH